MYLGLNVRVIEDDILKPFSIGQLEFYSTKINIQVQTELTYGEINYTI